MAKTKNAPAPTPPLVVVPPRTEVEVPLAVALKDQTARRTKKPLAAHEHPDARDSRGKATRTEVRHIAPRSNAPRASAKTPERSSQPRSSKAGKKT